MLKNYEDAETKFTCLISRVEALERKDPINKMKAYRW